MSSLSKYFKTREPEILVMLMDDFINKNYNEIIDIDIIDILSEELNISTLDNINESKMTELRDIFYNELVAELVSRYKGAVVHNKVKATFIAPRNILYTNINKSLFEEIVNQPELLLSM